MTPNKYCLDIIIHGFFLFCKGRLKFPENGIKSPLTAQKKKNPAAQGSGAGNRMDCQC